MVAGEETGEVSEGGAKCGGRAADEKGAGLGGGGEGDRLVLGSDGGQDRRLPPTDGAAAELHADGHVGDSVEAG